MIRQSAQGVKTEGSFDILLRCYIRPFVYSRLTIAHDRIGHEVHVIFFFRSFGVMSLCVVPSDATHEEAMEQIGFCLDQLLNLSNEIFDSLSSRLANLNERAERIQQNAQRAAGKVEQIREVRQLSAIFLFDFHRHFK